jgi:hypothetical protein
MDFRQDLQMVIVSRIFCCEAWKRIAILHLSRTNPEGALWSVREKWILAIEALLLNSSWLSVTGIRVKIKQESTTYEE